MKNKNPSHLLQVAMYQPDIPQNVGAMIRLCACLDVPLDIIEPCGFLWNVKKIRQSAMDYYEHAKITRHASASSFFEQYTSVKLESDKAGKDKAGKDEDEDEGESETKRNENNNLKNRIILMSTKASIPYTDFKFKCGDILLAGRESAGVPENIHQQVGSRVFIPMRNNLRSLNIVNATAMILGEALRQITD